MGEQYMSSIHWYRNTGSGVEDRRWVNSKCLPFTGTEIRVAGWQIRSGCPVCFLYTGRELPVAVER